MAPAVQTVDPARTTDVVADRDDATTLGELAALMARFRQVAAVGAGRVGGDVDLTPGQLAALLAVDEGASGVSAVADQCFTHLSNASRTVDALVRDGLLDRSRDPRDGRAVVLEPTAEGRRRLDHVHRRRDELVGAALVDVDPTDQARLIDLLTRLVGGLEAALDEED